MKPGIPYRPRQTGRIASAPLTCMAALTCMLALGLMAEDRAGIVPLENANKYPQQVEREDFFVGAKVLGAKDVERLFASDLNKNYVVVEVAIYPREGRLVEHWAHMDMAGFMQQIGGATEPEPAR